MSAYILYPILIGLFVFLYWTVGFSVYSKYKSFIRDTICEYFLPFCEYFLTFCGLSFHFLFFFFFFKKHDAAACSVRAGRGPGPASRRPRAESSRCDCPGSVCSQPGRAGWRVGTRRSARPSGEEPGPIPGRGPAFTFFKVFLERHIFHFKFNWFIFTFVTCVFLSYVKGYA